MKKNQSSKRKLPNTWKKSDTILAILASICILIFLIHYFVIPVKASSEINYSLPVQPEYYNEFITPEQLITLLQTAETQYHDNWSNGNYFIQFQDYTTNGNGHVLLTVQVTTIPDSYASFSTSITPSNYDSFDFVNYPSGITCAFGSRFRYVLNMNTKQVWNHTNNPSTVAIKYGNSPTTTNLGKYTSNCICYSTKSIYINSDSDKFVIQLPSDVPSIIPNGHATEPTFNPDNNINTDGHAQQPNDPQFPQFPTIVLDTTNVESLLESIFEAVVALGDYVGQCFSTFFAWLVSVIKNAIQAIINTMREVATFLYNNFVSLLEPMVENVGHAVEPVQENEIVQAFEDTGIYADFSSMTDLVNDSFDVFEDIEEPTTFRIPIHLENVTMLNCNTQYIDLGWFDSCKTALRAFMWCVTTFGLLYTIIDALPSYISGGDE